MCLQFGEVVTGAEAPALGGQNHDPGLRVGGHPGEFGAQRGDHRAAQRIEPGAAVQGQPDDSGIVVPQHVRLNRLVAHSIAVAEPAAARSTCFWIFPVEVFGTSPKTTPRGALNRGSRSRQ